MLFHAFLTSDLKEGSCYDKVEESTYAAFDFLYPLSTLLQLLPS